MLCSWPRRAGGTSRSIAHRCSGFPKAIKRSVSLEVYAEYENDGDGQDQGADSDPFDGVCGQERKAAEPLGCPYARARRR